MRQLRSSISERSRIGEIINKQSRQLTERERKRIRKHCEDGYEITRKGKLLRKYGDVDWAIINPTTEKWDIRQDLTTPPRLIVFIELIHIADSMDAATDSLERSYKGGIRFQQFLDELEQGRGSLYSPELVDLLHSDQALQEDLTYLLSAEGTGFTMIFSALWFGRRRRTARKKRLRFPCFVSFSVWTISATFWRPPERARALPLP